MSAYSSLILAEVGLKSYWRLDETLTYDGPIDEPGVVALVGLSPPLIGGVVTASGAADMRFDASGGLFVLSDESVFFHITHAWTPNPGTGIDRWVSIWLSNGEPDGGSTPAGCGYNLNEGLTPYDPPYWLGYCHIADILIPAAATRSDQCTIVDRRNFIWVDHGAGAAFDLKNGNNGIYENSPTLGAAGALVASGDNDAAIGPLDGTSQYVDVPDATSLRTDDVFTLEAWVKRGVTGASRTILCKGSNNPWLFLDSTGHLNLEIYATLVVTSTIAVPTGWHHIAATKSGATVKLYIDGQDVTGAVTNATLTSDTGDLFLAANAWGGANTFLNGYLDEVAIYNTALSGATVLAHYTAGVTPPIASDILGMLLGVGR